MTVHTDILLHSPADIIRQLLVDLSLGVNASYSDGSYDGSAWPVFASNEPGTPDNCITIYDTQGRDFGRSMIDGSRLEHFGFQVKIRASSHPVGFVKARAIAVGMDQDVYMRTVIIGSTTYLVHAINRTGQILTLGTDSPKTKRSIFTINSVVALARVPDVSLLITFP